MIGKSHLFIFIISLKFQCIKVKNNALEKYDLKIKNIILEKHSHLLRRYPYFSILSSIIKDFPSFA